MQNRDRFDKFTERARKVLSLAQEEAQRFQHNYIGTEHLLLGLVREGEGVAAKVLANLGVEINKVHGAIEFIIGRGNRIGPGEVGLTPRAKKVIGLAVDEATRLNHSYIGTEHLLLGLIREREGIAAGVLESQGVNLDQVRAEVQRVLGVTPQTTDSLPGTPLETKAPARDVNALLKEHPLWQFTNNFTDYSFTEQGKEAINSAEEEARSLQHPLVATEHLLLGLLSGDDSIAAKILKSAGLDPANIRTEFEHRMEHSPALPSNIPFTAAVRAQIHLAADEAQRRGKAQIGPEHILLGLIRVNAGITPDTQNRFNLDWNVLYANTVQQIESANQ